MARPFTRIQAQQNRAFLKLLARTGNVRLTCRELGLKYGTMQHRRRVDPAFAARWDAALVAAQAGFNATGKREGKKRDSRLCGNDDFARTGPLPGPHQSTTLMGTLSQGYDPSTSYAGPCDARLSPGQAARLGPLEIEGRMSLAGPFRTDGTEIVFVRTRNGRVQAQRAKAGKLTAAAEQAFLLALSATANVSLAAAAVGCSPHAFYRRRKKDPAFDREVRLALQRGYDALELALMESFLPQAHAHDGWRHNAPPAIPQVSANQALQLMYLHQKEARLLAEPFPIRRRHGEPSDCYNERLAQMAEERERRAREAFVLAELERMERGEPAWGPAGAEVRGKLKAKEGPSTASGPPPLESEGRMGLPDLAQVTGWSRADPGKGGHSDRALFGGWRLEEMQEQRDGSWE